MKKSTKIVSMVIAVTLVMAIMTFVIYAATAGKVGINASVSWTAQAGVDLEFWGKVTGGSENKEIAKTYINPTTTNATAKIVDDLSCNFSDNTDDGVNNPNAIVFRYYVRNKSLTPLKIQVTKYPTQAEESGTSEADHTPKVELSSQVGDENTLVSAIGAGYELKAGDTFEYSVTLSIASGGTGNINADTGLAPNFDAGVTFNFTVGGNSNGTIATSVDGATPTSVSSSTLSGQTLGEYLATRQTAEYSTGWFFDEGLTKVVSDDYLNQDLKDSSASLFYNKTASIEGLVFTLSSDGNSYLVSGESTTSPSGEVVIPNMYNGKPVRQTAKSAFNGNANITSVILPNTLLTLENNTFNSCSKLQFIVIPNSVTYIREYSISRNSVLTSLVIPSSLTKIESNRALCGNAALVHLSVAKDNPKYDSRNDCNAIIETSTNKLIQGCLTTEIPEDVVELGYSAFAWAGTIESITIPNKVKTIATYCFYFCNIHNVNFGDSLEIIGDSSFAHTPLSNVTLPYSLKEIKSGAFEATKITSIEIPKNVGNIGKNPFASCQSLISIRVADNNQKYDSRNDCNAIIETATDKLITSCKNTIIPDNIKVIGEKAFAANINLISIIIPNTVESIESLAFNGCTNLKSLSLNSGLKSIGERALYDCRSLTKLFIPNSVQNINAANISNRLFSEKMSNLQIYCEASSKPDGWGDYWNYYDSSNQLNVTWGYTRAQFDAL